MPDVDRSQCPRFWLLPTFAENLDGDSKVQALINMFSQFPRLRLATNRRIDNVPFISLSYELFAQGIVPETNVASPVRLTSDCSHVRRTLKTLLRSNLASRWGYAMKMGVCNFWVKA